MTDCKTQHVSRVHILQHKRGAEDVFLVRVFGPQHDDVNFRGGAAELVRPNRLPVDDIWRALLRTAARITDRSFGLSTYHLPPADPDQAPVRPEAGTVSYVAEGAVLMALLALLSRDGSPRVSAEAAGLDYDAWSKARDDDHFALAPLVSSFVRSQFVPDYPFSADTRHGAINTYDVTFYDRFSTPALDSHLIEREALARGLDTHRLTNLVFIASDRHGGSAGFGWSTTEETSHATGVLTGNKQVTRLLLQRAGAPVPEGNHFAVDEAETAVEYAATIGYPVVVKPLAGTGGVGVISGIQGEEGVRWAINALRNTAYAGARFIVERHITGNDYRIFATRDQVLSVAARETASVTGDGKLNVAELIVQKNVVRRGNPHLMGNPIRLNDVSIRKLSEQGLTPSAIPADGQRVILAAAANLAQGGDNIDVIQETHSTILEAVVEAVRAIPGLPHAGVDFILEDHRLPLGDQDAGICEFNCSAAQTANETPMYGAHTAISSSIVESEVKRKRLKTVLAPKRELTLEVKVRGRVQGVGYRQWVLESATHLGLNGWVRNARGNGVKALLSGPTHQVTVLVSAMMSGPPRARPESVQSIHSERQVERGFHVVG